MQSFERNLKEGLLGEGEISKWFRSKGWNVLPAYEVEIGSGKGPRLFTATTELVTPDMLIFRDGKILWIEAKTKTAFTWYRIGGCWQDGIDIRHWNDYCKVTDITKWPIWLLFLHNKNGVARDTPEGKIPPTGLFGEAIAKLRGCIDHESDRHAHGMVYWKIDNLRRLASVPLDTPRAPVVS